MNKQAPNLSRILIMVGFALSCFGLLLFLWLTFGGSTPLQAKGYRFNTSFGEATQLAKEADVRISGVSVGKVKSVVPDRESGRSQVVLELQPKYAPLPRDAKAILRQKTLLGETYVELTPGNGAKAGYIPENGTLAASRVSATVELDEITRAFDPETRAALQDYVQTLAVATKGRGMELNSALGNLQPLAENANEILTILNSQSSAIRRLVRNTGTVFSALGERQGQITQLIKNSNTVFETTASRDDKLQETFRALPTFERESRTTVERLSAFAENADPLVTQLQPAAKELSPTLQSVKNVSPDLKALFRDLRPAIAASKDGLPATRKLVRELGVGIQDPKTPGTDPGLLPTLPGVLAQLNPVLGYLGRNKQELTAFLANIVGATQGRENQGNDTEGSHYLRTVNPLNFESFLSVTQRLPTSRSNPYRPPGETVATGLTQYDPSTCGDPSTLPQLGPGAAPLFDRLPQGEADLLRTIFQQARDGVAPCKSSPDVSVLGKKGKFAQVGPSVNGAPADAVGK